MNKMNKKKKVWGVLFFVSMFAIIVLVVMLLWNAIVPAIIGWEAISYWQAAGLLLLCKLLFGGFGGHLGHRFFHSRGHHHHHGDHEKLHKMMKEMSRDERKKFIRERMARGFNFGEEEQEISADKNSNE